jgi:hypothetical protein
MWILGVIIIVVMALCLLAILFGGRGKGPFVALDRTPSARGKIVSPRGNMTDFHDDLRKPRDENELL